MKRLRRIAAVGAALLLGIAAWFTVLICYPTRGELRLSRELSSGMLIARVPEPQPLFFNAVVFGQPQLSGRYLRPRAGGSGVLPRAAISVERSRQGEQIWSLTLDPLDKSWDIEVREKRPLYLQLGKKSWRIGTKTRVWQTDRAARAEDG